MLSSDPRYVGRVRALAAQTRRNDAATLNTRQDLLNITASDARISAEVHAIAAAFGEKAEAPEVPASALVWLDVDNEVERQKKDQEREK